eukprot:Sspe_Gene.66386::Locus_39227_Transcript_2_2_Confidence_0.800_Length_1138::g.66386::m.66386
MPRTVRVLCLVLCLAAFIATSIMNDAIRFDTDYAGEVELVGGSWDNMTDLSAVIREGLLWSKAESAAGEKCDSPLDQLVASQWFCNHTTRRCATNRQAPFYEHEARCGMKPVCCSSFTVGVAIRTMAVLQKLRAPFVVTAGSLLGGVLYHGLIPFDEDIDVLLFMSHTQGPEEKEWFKRFKQAMCPYGMTVRRRPKSSKQPVESYIVELSKRNKNHITLEVAPVTRDGRYFTTSFNSAGEIRGLTGRRVPLSRFFPVSTVTMYNWTFPAPRDTTWWLEWLYGRNVFKTVRRKGCTMVNPKTHPEKLEYPREPPFVPATIALPEFCPGCCNATRRLVSNFFALRGQKCEATWMRLAGKP